MSTHEIAYQKVEKLSFFFQKFDEMLLIMFDEILLIMFDEISFIKCDEIHLIKFDEMSSVEFDEKSFNQVWWNDSYQV